MSTTARTLARAALLGGLALVTAAVTATSAGAASEEAEFSCEFGVGEPEGEGTEGEGTGTASFDTGIPDGLVVDVGARVSLDPFTGSITLPEEFVTMLRDAGLTTVLGGGEAYLFVDPTEDELYATFEFGTTELPAEGTITLDVEGEADRYRAEDPGVHTILGMEFVLFVGTDDEEGPNGGMFCETADGEGLVIDAFEATAVANPAPTTTVTATTTATATAVRPVVVQTDFADDESSSPLPLVLGGGLLALGTGLVVSRGRAQRGGARRH